MSCAIIKDCATFASVATGQNKIQISGSIITYNEEAKIGLCIASMLKVCDEVIVLDSFSDDDTVDIARSLGAIVHQQKFAGHIEQKNAAVDLAMHDWILSLDADEQLSDKLAQSIMEVKAEPRYVAYRFNRLNNYCGQWIRHGTWYPDRKIRLWRKVSGVWGGENPHDRIVLERDVAVGFLKGDLLHYTASTKQEWEDQIENFSSIQAQNLAQREFHPTFFHHFVKPFFRFIMSYVLRLGVLDGKAGFEIASGQAKLVRRRYAKVSRSYGDVKSDL